MKSSYKDRITHPFDPVFDSDSKILILGSFPSVKSREQGFYYGHKQNRFWKAMEAIFDCSLATIEAKEKLLHQQHIALYDVIYQCDIIGSADSSIENVITTDLLQIIHTGKINKILTNGKLAHKYYMQYQYPLTGIKDICLPSTSSANASVHLDELIQIYGNEVKQ